MAYIFRTKQGIIQTGPKTGHNSNRPQQIQKATKLGIFFWAKPKQNQYQPKEDINLAVSSADLKGYFSLKQ